MTHGSSVGAEGGALPPGTMNRHGQPSPRWTQQAPSRPTMHTRRGSNRRLWRDGRRALHRRLQNGPLTGPLSVVIEHRGDVTDLVDDLGQLGT